MDSMLKTSSKFAQKSSTAAFSVVLVAAAALFICGTEAASIALNRRAIFSLNSDAPRRHYEELIASRQIRSHDASSDEIEDKPQTKTTGLRMHQSPPSQVVVAQNDRLELHCDVSGSPPPAVYWLKNGQPIAEAPFDMEEKTNKILESDSLIPSRGLASTKSRLVIDCAGEDTEAIYTCVAESRVERLVSSTYVHIEGIAPYNQTACELKKDARFLPATIFMWSGTYIEEEGQDAVLVCRAAGFPHPKVTWFGRDGRVLTTGYKYELLPTGDLKIRHLRWKDDMGGYVCHVENQFGSDESLTFLYPTLPES